MAEVLLQCLEGSLPVGEKFKTINKIFKQLKPFQVDEILAVLKTMPKYNVMRLKLADNFKRSSCVLDILENGDKLSISRAAKLPWMYVDGSDLVNADFLVTVFFPRISFLARLKIIDNLGRHLQNSQIADSIFSFIESKYGFPVVSAMLPACSEEVIMKSIESNRKHKLSSTQLLIIIKMYPITGINYLKKLYDRNERVKIDYSSILKYLLDHQTKDVISVLIQYPDKWEMSLGAERSKRVLRLCSAEAVELLSKKPNFFKRSQLRKYLSPQQYEQAFLNAGFRFIEILKTPWPSREFWQWLDHLPDFHKIALLRKVFRVTFDKEITECPQYVTPDMLVLLPIEERMKIINWKLDNNASMFVESLSFQHTRDISSNFERFWIALKPTKDSIPELTRILNSEGDCNKREELFSFFITSCIFNKDSEALVKVLQLLTKKCRNDKPEIRQVLISAMNEATLHFQFEEEHWACFQELIQFVQLYEELEDDTDVVDLLGKYAAFRQRQGKSFDAEINSIIKFIPNYWHPVDISHIKEPEYRRAMIEGYIKAFSLYAEKSGGLTHARGGYVDSLIKEIVKWNRCHQQKLGPINVYNYPWLEKRCWESISKKSDDCQTIESSQRTAVFELLRQGNHFRPRSLDKILDNAVIYVPELYYSLKTNPEKIAENVESIMSYILKISNSHEFNSFIGFVEKLKATYHWTLLDKIKGECKKILNHDNPKSFVTEIGNAVQLLAILESPSDFLSFASNYYPEEAKLDPSVPIDELDYKIKESIAGSLKYLPPLPTLLFPVVDRFLVDDYVKFVLSSLYSTCSSAPESEVLAYLQSKLNDQPVSVRKHTILLFFLISPLDGKFKALEKMWSCAKDPSTRYEILKQIYDLFNSKPQEKVWILLKSSVESLTDEDTLSLNFVKNSIIIDEKLDKFLTDFFRVVLATFKRTGVYKTFEKDIIARIVGIVSKFEEDFLDSLMYATFSDIRSSTVYKYSQLVENYLIDESIPPKIRIHRQNVVQQIIQDVLDHHWNVGEVDYYNKERPAYPARNLLEHICQDICNNLLDYRRKDKSVDIGKEILQGLLKQLESEADITKTFKNIIYIKFTLVALEIIELENNGWLRSFGQRVAPLLSFYSEKYGGEIVCIVSTILKEVSNRMFDKIGDENFLRIIDGILENKNDKYQLITAITLLPQTNPSSAELLKMKNRIISIIKSSKDTTVRLYLSVQESEDEDVEIFN